MRVVSKVILRSETTKNLMVGTVAPYLPEILRYAQGDRKEDTIDTKPPLWQEIETLGARL
jgi:hypothetical protein